MKKKQQYGRDKYWNPPEKEKQRPVWYTNMYHRMRENALS